jgi:hypothetical protein
MSHEKRSIERNGWAMSGQHFSFNGVTLADLTRDEKSIIAYYIREKLLTTKQLNLVDAFVLKILNQPEFAALNNEDKNTALSAFQRKLPDPSTPQDSVDIKEKTAPKGNLTPKRPKPPLKSPPNIPYSPKYMAGAPKSVGDFINAAARTLPATENGDVQNPYALFDQVRRDMRRALHWSEEGSRKNLPSSFSALQGTTFGISIQLSINATQRDALETHGLLERLVASGETSHLCAISDVMMDPDTKRFKVLGLTTDDVDYAITAYEIEKWFSQNDLGKPLISKEYTDQVYAALQQRQQNNQVRSETGSSLDRA